MTFEEFAATGRAVESLPDTACDQGLEEGPGRVYAQGLYIEGDSTTGYHLTIGNSQTSGALTDLERQLYAFGVSEDYISE